MNPHHRFWCHQANAEVPDAAAGRAVGRPELRAAGSLRPGRRAQGLRAEKCFIDNVEAWSTNEVTINWNAPLAWVAAFLDEQARKAK